MDMKPKNKRSPNYTLQEKKMLLSIISKYQNIIDCKKTGAYYLQQKNEVWESIVEQYNSICTTGLRNVNMLKHFYNNIKHRARKSSATDNKKRHSEQSSEIKTNDVIISQPSNNFMINGNIIVNENFLNDLKKKCADEQINPNDQIQPHGCPHDDDDDAAKYFGDTVEENSSSDLNPQPKPNSPKMPRRRKIIRRPLITHKHSLDELKKIFVRKKIELTYLQKKNEIQRFRFEQKKYELELQILHNQLQKTYRDLA